MKKLNQTRRHSDTLRCSTGSVSDLSFDEWPIPERTGRLRSPYCIIFLAIAVFCSSGVNAAPSKYNGSWVLNREKSEGLTGAMDGAEILLVVSQDNKRLYVEQKVNIRGRQQPSQELIWNLDGSETTAEVVRPMAGTMRLKAKWNEVGKTLDLHSSIQGDDQGKEVSVTVKEIWELLDNGKSLKITRLRTSPQGRQAFRLFFDKQE